MTQIQWLVHGGSYYFGVRFNSISKGWQVVYKTASIFGVQGGYYPTKNEAVNAAFRYCSA